MSKKHFVAFAEEIRLSNLDEKGKREVAQMVIRVGSKDNPNFDKGRFLTACGL